MSHFYSSCEGGRGAATRSGHKTTGISAYAQGKHCGIRIHGHYDPETGQDVFQINIYGGQYGDESMTMPLKVYCADQSDTIQVVHYGHKGDYNNMTESQTKFEFMDEIESGEEVDF
jgi:hypothetical protein